VTQYYETLKAVCENALLNLYLEVRENSRWVTVESRTKIIKKFIKPKVKMAEYKIVKKELKRMALMSDKIPLEAELHKLIVNLDTYKGKGDAELELFALLADMHKWSGFMVSISNKRTIAEPGNIYLLEDEVFTNLDKDGNYTRPVDVYVYSHKEAEIDLLVTHINSDERFTANIVTRHDSHAKLALSPKK
jgi:hypothetical protein